MDKKLEHRQAAEYNSEKISSRQASFDILLAKEII